MATHFTPKSADFRCIPCDFICSKKSDWSRHSKTVKHSYRLSNPHLATSATQKAPQHICEICNAIYHDRTGLWRHKKKYSHISCNECKEDNATNMKDDPTDKQLIVMLVKENANLAKDNIEFKNIMMEVIKNGTHHTTNNNSHNKSFNLQFFLNETCKDAMNIMDFVDSIKLQLSDLERVGKIGYVEGITNIIVKNLKSLNVTERPIHCTDKKRETIYIKDEDKWEKDEENTKINKVIAKVADKNARLIQNFRDKYPDCIKSASNHSDQYNKIIVESMGGAGDNDSEKVGKIISKMSKEIIISKM